MFDHLGGETVGEVYLPPTPLRRGGGHRRAPESSEGKWAFFGSTCTSRAYNNWLGIRIGYTFEFVVHGLPLVLISYGIIFVAYYLSCSEQLLLRISGPQWAPKGSKGPEGPLGPKGPKGPLVP